MSTDFPTSHPQPETHLPADSLPEAAARGFHHLVSSPQRLILSLATLFLLLLMAPVGRTGPNDAGGLLAPLAADSGSRFLFRLRPATDFFSIYDAGDRAWRGMDPFGVNDATGGPGLRAPYVATYRYFPITAYWLGIPLNLLPPWWSYALWCCLTMGMVILGCLVSVGRYPKSWAVQLLIWGAWFPLIPELHMGQFSLFMAFLMWLWWDGVFTGRPNGGWAWVLAVLLKVYPLGMALPMLIWGRWKPVVAVVAILLISTIAWNLSDMADSQREGMSERGIEGRIISSLMQPYAGAQGFQAMVNMMVWKIEGRSFGESGPPGPPSFNDPVSIITGLIAGLVSLLCAWAAWIRRNKPSLEVVALFWISWFFLYRDAWEHHYVLIQPLLALLTIHRILEPRIIVPLWICLGAPSLWWPWQRFGYSGNAMAELLGILYFLQRPVGLIILAGLMVRRLLEKRA